MLPEKRRLGVTLLLCAFALAAAGCGSRPQNPAPSPETSGESPVLPSPPSPDRGAQDGADILLSVNGTPVTVIWEENDSVKALAALLEIEDICVNTEAYGGFEQVGRLPQAIVRDDVQMTTGAGDIVLYSGDSLVLFYGSNNWAYTMLGHIEGFSQEELNALLGVKQAEISLSLAR